MKRDGGALRHHARHAVSAWLGLGFAQAALRGGLRSSDEIAHSCHYTKSYQLSPPEVAMTTERLSALGVDVQIVQRVRELGQGEIRR